MFYIISQSRLLNEINYNAKGKGKGQLNWFAEEKNGQKILSITFNNNGVAYLCRIPYMSTDDISPIIKVYLDPRFEILGFELPERESNNSEDFEDVIFT